jgi:multiple sugar transport system permease protein
MPATKRNLAEELRSTRHGWLFHIPLVSLAALFLLPLVWMLSISLKPLEQTTDPSFDPLPRGYYVTTPAGKLLPVYRERKLVDAGYLVRTTSGKHPGTVNFVREPDLKDKLARLPDGEEVTVEIISRIKASERQPLWLVREWRDKDVDTKGVSAVQGDVTRYVAVVSPEEISQAVKPLWINYPTGLKRMNFWGALLNTLLVCVMGVIGVTTASVLVAYGLAFIDFRGRKLLFVLTLATMMIPFPAVMVPLFGVFRWLGWVGTFKPLWVPAWFGSAFFIFLLRQFFKGIPKDLLDSARLAGASELQILWHVVLPLSRPALAMVALFHFLYCWKDFMGPLLYLNDQARHTLSLALQNFHAEQGGTPWHLMMAASVVFSLPLIVLFFLTVKTFIRSITMTGLKG